MYIIFLGNDKDVKTECKISSCQLGFMQSRRVTVATESSTRDLAVREQLCILTLVSRCE